MLNLEKYTIGFIEKEGILFSKGKSTISYPENRNELCYHIEDSSFWFTHRNNCIITAIKKLHCPDDIFFDIGGGNGFVTKGLEENGIQTILVEPDFTACLNAKKRNLKNIICSDLINAHFNNGNIYAIGLFDVIEHIENDIEFLKHIHSILQKNGHVYITVPAFNILWSNKDFNFIHYRRYTIKELARNLKNTGFTIEYSTYLFSFLFIPIFLFRAIPNLLRFNKKTYNFEKHKNEHKRRKGIIGKFIEKICEFELNRIKSGKKILIGSTCFVIGTKK